MSDKKLTRIRLFQRQEENLIPVDIYVDERFVIDRIQGPEVAGLENAPRRKTPDNDPRTAATDLGLDVERKDGKIIIRSVDDRTQKIMPFFTKAPCWFEGCAELRKEYQRELQAAEAKAKAEDRECQGCERGAINEKYIKLLRGNEKACGL